MPRISVNINLNQCLFVLFPFAFINLANARYKGGVILVSHDERLLKMVCQELWVCSKGKVQIFCICICRFVLCFGSYVQCFQVWSIDGGLEEYRKMVEKEMILS